jgi:hypothetical protein
MKYLNNMIPVKVWDVHVYALQYYWYKEREEAGYSRLTVERKHSSISTRKWSCSNQLFRDQKSQGRVAHPVNHHMQVLR